MSYHIIFPWKPNIINGRLISVSKTDILSICPSSLSVFVDSFLRVFVMASSMCVATVRDLHEGRFEMGIIVKVDRIITRSVVRHPYGPHRPMIEQEDINVVVFDESVSF